MDANVLQTVDTADRVQKLNCARMLRLRIGCVWLRCWRAPDCEREHVLRRIKGVQVQCFVAVIAVGAVELRREQVMPVRGETMLMCGMSSISGRVRVQLGKVARGAEYGDPEHDCDDPLHKTECMEPLHHGQMNAFPWLGAGFPPLAPHESAIP